MTTKTHAFLITAIIAGELVSRVMHLYGRVEDVAKHLRGAIPEADSITVEYADNPQGYEHERRIGYEHGLDIAL